MSNLDPILETAYRRAGIQVESAPVPVEVEAQPVEPAAGETKPLTESELETVMLARAGIKTTSQSENS